MSETDQPDVLADLRRLHEMGQDANAGLLIGDDEFRAMVCKGVLQPAIDEIDQLRERVRQLEEQAK